MARRLKIKLIEPSRYRGGTLQRVQRLLFPPLTLPLVAALTPDDFDVTIHNDSFEPVDYDEQVDLVGLTAYTAQALRAYEIADEYRRRGVHVAMGGIHASMLPDEAAEHADTVFVGEAEQTWPQFLADFTDGRAEARYQPETLPDLSGLPLPKFSLMDSSRYVCCRTDGLNRLLPTPMLPVQTARGCPHGCEFCSVTALNGRKFRTRPIDDVIREIRSGGARSYMFLDDNIFAIPRRAKDLFEALIPLKISWHGQGTVDAAKDPELLQLARRSGLTVLFIGLESLSAGALKAMGKTQNVVADYGKHLQAFRKAGVSVMASMIFGFGPEEPDVFDKTCDFLMANRVSYAAWWPLTPFPGTGLFDRLKKEGRLKQDAWWLDPSAGSELVDFKFTGLDMGEETFRTRFHRAYRRFYSLRGIFRRVLLPPQKRCFQKTVMNLMFRKRVSPKRAILES